MLLYTYKRFNKTVSVKKCVTKHCLFVDNTNTEMEIDENQRNLKEKYLISKNKSQGNHIITRYTIARATND